MRKKFYISFLTLIFFLSTTSLPVSIHLCEMADILSLEDCSMCEAEKIEKNCCESEKSSNDIEIKRENSSSSCCSNQLVDAAVKDNFLSAKTDIQNFSSFKFFAPLTLSKEFDSYNNITLFIDKDTSPPLLETNQLFLLNSVFLI